MVNIFIIFLCCLGVLCFGLVCYIYGYEKAAKENNKNFIRLYNHLLKIADGMGEMSDNIKRIAEVLKNERK